MSNIETNLIIRGFDKTADAFKSVDRNLKATGDKVKEANAQFENITKVSKTMAIAGGVAFGALSLGVKTFVSDALEAERVTATFDSMTASIGSNRTAIEGLRKATYGLVNDTDLMKAGNKFMAMGLATNTEEMNKLAEMAVKLGSAMGNDATSSMDNFALMLSNQSVMRLDSFGISSGKVRERIDELMNSIDGMTREQAFMQATMEQGEASMKKLGDTTLTNGEKMQQFQARMANLRNTLGDALIPMLTKILEKVQPVIDKFITWTEKNPELASKILLITTGIAGLILVLGTLGMLLTPIVTAFTVMGAVIGGLSLPILAIVALLAVIGGAIYYLASNWQQHWDNIKWAVGIAGDFMKQIWESIKAGFSAVIEAVVNFAKAFYDANLPLQIMVGTVKGIILALDILLHVLMGLFILAQPYISAGIDWVKQAFADMVAWVGEKLSWVGPMLTAIGTFLQSLVTLWQQLWQSIVDFMTPVAQSMVAKFDLMKAGLQRMIDGAKDILKGFGNFFIGIGEGIGNAWVSMVNGIIGALNKIQISIPDWVPKYGGQHFGINIAKASEISIPRLAEGGIATKSILANIGEAGPEAIIPLNRMNQFAKQQVPPIHVYIDTFVGEESFAEKIGDKLATVLMRNGQVQA